jgi:hypothetical protein
VLNAERSHKNFFIHHSSQRGVKLSLWASVEQNARRHR